MSSWLQACRCCPAVQQACSVKGTVPAAEHLFTTWRAEPLPPHILRVQLRELPFPRQPVARKSVQRWCSEWAAALQGLRMYFGLVEAPASQCPNRMLTKHRTACIAHALKPGVDTLHAAHWRRGGGSDCELICKAVLAAYRARKPGDWLPQHARAVIAPWCWCRHPAPCS